MSRAFVVLGNQLLREHPALSARPDDIVIMIEAQDICSKRLYHKHKLVLILAAMRDYRDYLRSKGITVVYHEITTSTSFLAGLKHVLVTHHITELQWMDTADTSPGQRLKRLCNAGGITYSVHPNQQFLTRREEFTTWYSGQKQPRMESFYQWQRRRTGILMNGTQPEGGIWNFDAQNRRPLPKSGVYVPPLVPPISSENTKLVTQLVEQLFPSNPGRTADFWLPTTFAGADMWLDQFVARRLSLFGPYEDASRQDEPFLFHSVLSPLLNIGLLSPKQVVDAVLRAYQAGLAPLNSVEGCIRQIIGWREYMYGMYVQTPGLMDANYFGFSKELEPWWYDETYLLQDLPLPILSVLKTLHTYGYNHHIERLMVLGNWFLLNEYNPQSVFRWFSSMYVDAYDWVMVPNVQGMSQYADGGVIATKPYISGGSYLQKMGRWWATGAEAQSSAYTTLYWDFLIKHRSQLEGNFRMQVMLNLAQKVELKRSHQGYFKAV